MMAFLVQTLWANEFSCGMMNYWDDVHNSVVPNIRMTSDVKLERDALSSEFIQLSSENFVLKWGTEYITTGIEEAILESFEAVWERQLVEWGMPAPFGTDSYLFNVYIGNTGSNAPTVEPGVGGYYTRDSQGWPIIVLNPSSLSATLIAHEFFHALQDASGSYGTPEGRWFWESTAEWAAAAMNPNSTQGVSAIGNYLALSHESIDTFVHLYDAETEEDRVYALYAYGSVLFPIYLNEITGEEQLIPQVWKQGSPWISPLSTIEVLLAERGFDFYDVWMDHNTSTIFMDEYTYGGMYQELAGYDWWDQWTGSGTAMTEDTSDISVEHLGFRVHRLSSATESKYRFQVWADPIGTYDSIAEFRAFIMQRKGLEYRKIPLEINHWFGEITISDVDEFDDMYLVVGAWADRYYSSFQDDEQFFYSFAMEGIPEIQYPESEQDDVEYNSLEDEIICGCSTHKPFSVFGLCSILFVVYRRSSIE